MNSRLVQEENKMRMLESERRERRYTAKGTLCARSWPDEWVAEVEAVEARLGRRICGARTMEGTPCVLGSTHASGRCRFHGGFDLTGAPKGNRNAVLHGLYSRRLLVCGRHCAQWEVCPLAGEDVLRAGATGGVGVREDRGGRGDRGGRVDRGGRTGAKNETNGTDETYGVRGNDEADGAEGIEGAEAADGEEGTKGTEAREATKGTEATDGGDGCVCRGASRERAVLYTCPYEQAEYNAVLTDGLARVEACGDTGRGDTGRGDTGRGDAGRAVAGGRGRVGCSGTGGGGSARGDAFDVHTVHMVALLQVMVSRAATALRQAALHETVLVETGDYRQESTKLHTYLQAFLRLQREHERLRRHLDDLRPAGQLPDSVDLGVRVNGKRPVSVFDVADGASLPQEPSVAAVKRHERRAAHDTNLDPDAQAEMHVETAIARDQAERELARAILYGTHGRDVAMLDAMERAYLLDPELTEQREDTVLALYRNDQGQVLPEAAVKRIVKAMGKKGG